MKLSKAIDAMQRRPALGIFGAANGNRKGDGSAAAANIIHAIDTNNFDWLLWLSVGLCALSIILTIACSMGEKNG